MSPELVTPRLDASIVGLTAGARDAAHIAFDAVDADGRPVLSEGSISL